VSKKALISSLILFLLLFGIIDVGATKANPTWLFQPNQDEPVLIIETPQNYTTINGGGLILNFTVTKPCSWNESNVWNTIPAGMIDSVTVTLNGKEVFADYPSSLSGLLNNVTNTYSVTVKKFDSGMNTLRVNVLAHTAAGYGYTDEMGEPTAGANTLRMNVTDTLIVNYPNQVNANLTLQITGIFVVAIVAMGLLVYFAKRRGVRQ